MPPYSDLQFYIDNLYERFLVSRKTPTSWEEELEIKKIAAALSVLSWIGQSNFCLDEEALILEAVKELYENFKQAHLFEKISEIIQKFKNISEKTKLKTQILEQFVELEYKGCLDKRVKYPLDQNSLNVKFRKVIAHINQNFKEKNLIGLMKLERDVKEIKQKYLKGLLGVEDIERVFNSLIDKSQF